MLLSGDEPTLGGIPAAEARADNSPMLSGVRTHVIVDARGAYLAGSLDALIGAMTIEQQGRFKRAVIRQGLNSAREVLLSEGKGIEREAAAVVGRWLNQPEPSSDTLRDVARVADILFDEGAAGAPPTRLQGQLAYYVVYAVTLSPPLAVLAVRHVVSLAKYLWGHPAGQSAPAAIAAACRWQVEAAWAILQGKEPPPLEAFS